MKQIFFTKWVSSLTMHYSYIQSPPYFSNTRLKYFIMQPSLWKQFTLRLEDVTGKIKNCSCMDSNYEFLYPSSRSKKEKKFCITIVSHFYWVLQSSQKKWKTIVKPKLGRGGGGLGGNKVHNGQNENGEFDKINVVHLYGNSWKQSIVRPSVLGKEGS